MTEYSKRYYKEKAEHADRLLQQVVSALRECTRAQDLIRVVDAEHRCVKYLECALKDLL